MHFSLIRFTLLYFTRLTWKTIFVNLGFWTGRCVNVLWGKTKPGYPSWSAFAEFSMLVLSGLNDLHQKYVSCQDVTFYATLLMNRLRD